jgi:hypothetical protein
MPVITVRNVPDHIYKEIKKAAQSEKRSLNNQCLYIFEQFSEKSKPAEVVLNEIKALRDRVGPINYSPEEVKALIEEGRP